MLPEISVINVSLVSLAAAFCRSPSSFQALSAFTIFIFFISNISTSVWIIIFIVATKTSRTSQCHNMQQHHELQLWGYVAMDQHLWLPCLGGWRSINQLSDVHQGYRVLTHSHVTEGRGDTTSSWSYQRFYHGKSSASVAIWRSLPFKTIVLTIINHH